MAVFRRLKAAGIHLCISGTLIGGALVATVWLLYPGAFFYAAGGHQLVLILAAVDVTIGPLITLLIYDTAKKSLKSDLTVVALLQLAALAYGSFVIYEARPVFVVFAIDRFELVRAPEIDARYLRPISSIGSVGPWSWGPTWVGARVPADPEERLALVGSALQGRDIQFYPQYYVPLLQEVASLKAKALPITRLLTDRTAEHLIQRSARAAHVDVRDVGYLPLNARAEALTVLVDLRNGSVIDVIRMDPW